MARFMVIFRPGFPGTRLTCTCILPHLLCARGLGGISCQRATWTTVSPRHETLDVLMFVVNIVPFTQAGTTVSTMLRLPANSVTRRSRMGCPLLPHLLLRWCLHSRGIFRAMSATCQLCQQILGATISDFDEVLAGVCDDRLRVEGEKRHGHQFASAMCATTKPTQPKETRLYHHRSPPATRLPPSLPSLPFPSLPFSFTRTHPSSHHISPEHAS